MQEKIPMYYSQKMGELDYGKNHPFDSARFNQFIDLLSETGYIDLYDVRTPEKASLDDLYAIHTRKYVNRVLELEKRSGYLSMDTQVIPGLVGASLLVVGSVLESCKAVADEGGIVQTFGGFHHAGREYGEGFCLFNDVALATRFLQEEKGYEKVMVVDTDAHQGNGTMDIFYDDPSVLFVSIHQDPRTIYPGKGFVHEIGKGAGEGYTINLPVPVHSGIDTYRFLLESIVLPLMEEFAPDVVIRNGGCDPHHADVLTDLGLDFSGLWEVNRTVAGGSRKTCGRHIDLVASGYGKLVKLGWLSQFLGTADVALYADIGRNEPQDPFARVEPVKMRNDREMVRLKSEVAKHLGQYWECL